MSKKNCLRESFSGQKHSQFKRFTEKVWKVQIKFSEFDCLTGYSVLFLCYLKLISFLCYLKLIVFLCYLLLCYLVRNRKFSPVASLMFEYQLFSNLFGQTTLRSCRMFYITDTPKESLVRFC